MHVLNKNGDLDRVCFILKQGDGVWGVKYSTWKNSAEMLKEEFYQKILVVIINGRN